jgi:hypothetical protein
VRDILGFLAGRVLELEDGLSEPADGEAPRLRAELDMTSHLIDLVLYEFHGVAAEDVERIEAGGLASG